MTSKHLFDILFYKEARSDNIKQPNMKGFYMKTNHEEDKKQIKPWSATEEQRSREISDYVTKMIHTGGFEEFYEQNEVDEIYRQDISEYCIPGLMPDEIVISKMNLIYAGYWDEDDNRVKKGKPVTGSIHYMVQTEHDGAIDEDRPAYKTKADAIHAMELYLDYLKHYKEEWLKNHN